MENQIQKTQIEAFTQLIREGIEKWKKAGELVVKLVDEGGFTHEQIAEKSELSPSIVARFEQLGRQQLMPYLLMATYPAAKKVIKLPYSEQRRLQNGSIDLLLEESGGFDTLKVMPKNLTPDQCKQVFATDHIRDIAEQRAWLESRKREIKESEARRLVLSQDEPYVIQGKNKVVFSRPCEMSRKDLLRVLGEMD